LDKTSLQTLFDSFDRNERISIMEEAGLAHLAVAGNFDVNIAPERILPAVLRRTPVSDDKFAFLVSESRIALGGRLLPDMVTVTLSFSAATYTGIPITGLTAASILIWEVTARVASVLNGLSLHQEELRPPGVNVTPGSVSFSLGGSTLLVSGVGFLIACHAQMLPQDAASLTYYGGALLSSVGLVDLAVNWFKTIREAIKDDSETQLNRIKVRQAERELGAEERKTVGSPATLISPENIAIESRQFGVPEPLAVHLLNRVLPALQDLSIASGRPVASVSSEGGTGSGRAMSATS